MSKLVCISGCSRGLGRAMAKEFASRAWKVAGGARNKEALLKLKEELGDRHFLDTFDVTFPTQVDDFAKKVVSNVGIPDLKYVIDCLTTQLQGSRHRVVSRGGYQFQTSI